MTNRANAKSRIGPILIIVFILGIAALVSIILTRPPPKPQISITVKGYETWPNMPHILANVVVTNIGRTTILFTPGAFAVRTEDRGNWVTHEPGQESGSDLVYFYVSGTLLLPPDAKIARQLPLPPRTTKWQLSYTVRNARGQYSFDATPART